MPLSGIGCPGGEEKERLIVFSHTEHTGDTEEKMNIQRRTSNTRLPCITNYGDTIIVTGARHEDILPRLRKGIAGRSNIEWEGKERLIIV